MSVFILMLLLVFSPFMSAMDKKRNDVVSTFIVDAIKRGDCASVKTLTKAHQFDISDCDATGRNLLFAAIPVHSQNLFYEKSILKNHLKILKAVPSIIECLIKRGISLHQQDIYGFNTLMLLMYISPAPQIYLSFTESQYIAKYKKQYRSYVHKAVETLLKAGLSVTAQDKGGRTACHHVAKGGDVDSMNLLLTYKANLWQQDGNGNTCVHDIARCGRVDLAELIRTNETEYQKNLAILMMLIHKEKGGTKWMPRPVFRKIIDTLLSSGLFSVKNANNKTAYDIAHQNRSEGCGDWFYAESRFYNKQERLLRTEALIDLVDPRPYYAR